MGSFCYDTEFLELGPTRPISPLSIGIVSDDGSRSYYAINRDGDWSGAYSHEWLRVNVIPHMPGTYEGGDWTLDVTHPDVKSRELIRDEVYEFLCPDGAGAAGPELWAWYGAYDHVVLAQLFGTMSEMPTPLPYLTFDLKQEQALHAPDHRFTTPKVREHHALADAIWTLNAKRELTARLGESVFERLARETEAAERELAGNADPADYTAPVRSHSRAADPTQVYHVRVPVDRLGTLRRLADERRVGVEELIRNLTIDHVIENEHV